MLDWEWYYDTNTVRVFIHILLKANYEDKVWRGIPVKRGSYITSLRKLAKETGLSLQQIRNTLSNTETTHDTTQSSTHKYTIITINNYDKYQQGNTRCISKPTHQPTTTKDNKEIKNKEYNTIEKITDKELNEVSKEYGVGFNSVKKVYEELVLYCGSTGKKYANYKMTLMAWVRRRMEEKGLNRSKELREEQIEDIRLHPEKLFVYKTGGYDVSRLTFK